MQKEETELTRKEDNSTDLDIDECSSSAQDDPSAAGTTEQAENFATELSSIRTACKCNLMTTSLSVWGI